MCKTMNSLAFSKIVMHAAKYPHCAVNGVLLGTKTKGSETSIISDSVPLFHINLTLLPPLEVALSQIEAYCADSTDNLRICGYYHIHSSLSDKGPDSFTIKLMERMNENCGDHVLLFQFDNQKLDLKEVPYTTYVCKDGKLIATESRVNPVSGSLNKAMKCVTNKTYQKLVDFDNHLDDITLDWRNVHLNDI